MEMGTVTGQGLLSEPFDLDTRVRKGYVLEEAKASGERLIRDR